VIKKEEFKKRVDRIIMKTRRIYQQIKENVGRDEEEWLVKEK